MNIEATDSPRAIAARTNGAKSRGPKTEEGKAKSSRNALKHGFAATRYIHLPGDEEGAFEEFAEGILTDLNPHGPLQEALAESIVHCMWRKRRVIAMESHLVREEEARYSTCLNYNRYDWPQAHLALAKYESHLDRCLHRALKDLQELQSTKSDAADTTDQTENPLQQSDLQNEPNESAHSTQDQGVQTHERHLTRSKMRQFLANKPPKTAPGGRLTRR